MITQGVNTQNNDSSLLTPRTEAPSDAETAASDFQNFLMLLTQQLRNQDPLAPIDSTQFVEQLASFSSVEQQIKTNDHLKELTASLTASSLEGATQWIGKQVEVETGAARFEGNPVEFNLPKNASGHAAEVVVKDARGNVIYRESLTSDATTFTWNGGLDDGSTAPNGDYQVSINHWDGETLIDTKTPNAFTNVLEARIDGGAATLVLANGATTDPSDVMAVRAATTDEG